MGEVTSFFKMDEPDVLQVMNQADANADGLIDYTEFLTAAFQKQVLLQEDNLERAFKIFDVDGDGQITLDELKGGFGANNSQEDKLWKEIMMEVDTNGDGLISYEEFVAHMQ